MQVHYPVVDGLNRGSSILHARLPNQSRQTGMGESNTINYAIVQLPSCATDRPLPTSSQLKLEKLMSKVVAKQ